MCGIHTSHGCVREGPTLLKCVIATTATRQQDRLAMTWVSRRAGRRVTWAAVGAVCALLVVCLVRVLRVCCLCCVYCVCVCCVRSGRPSACARALHGQSVKTVEFAKCICVNAAERLGVRYTAALRLQFIVLTLTEVILNRCSQKQQQLLIFLQVTSSLRRYGFSI